MNRLSNGLAAGVMIFACLAGGAGCMHRTSGTEVSGVMVSTPDGKEELSRAVIINNARLGRRIQVVDVRHEYAGDLLKPGVTLASKYAGTLKFQYKFAWFNAAGLEIDPDGGAWTPVLLLGNETRTVQGVAPNAEAKAFKIKIRE